MNKVLSPLFHLSLCTLGCLYASSTQAQVTSDGTVNTQVNQNGNVAEITGGQKRGGNLFHSFQDFSVGAGDTASFLNSNDIANIFSRVTGGNISNIDGLIGANGSANLFLINPAGIIFGQNARLDVGGSFYGSTADSVLFKDGEFSATDLENPPVLTINAPIGLGFRDNPASIEGSNIQTTDKPESFPRSVRQNLALIGGDIDLEDAILNLPGGQITIGGLASAGTIQINENGSLSFPDDASLADVSLLNSQLGVEATIRESTGNQVESGNVEILANSIFLYNSQVVSGVEQSGIGDSGDINISTGNLNLINGSRIATVGFGQGNTGDIRINATEGVFLEGTNAEGVPSSIVTSVEEGGSSNSGNIEINSGSLSLFNGAYIFAGVFGVGDSGNIDIQVNEDIKIRGSNNEDFSAGIFSEVFEGGRGNGGDINIIADRSISLSAGGQINSSTNGLGNAGNLNIQANFIELSGNKDLKDLNDSGLFTAVQENGRGNAGNLTLNTENLSVSDGATISAGTFGEGDGGTIRIAANNIELVNGNIQSSVEAKGSGNAGNLTLNTENLSVSDGATISASTFGEGDGGTIRIAANNIELVNGNIQSSVEVKGKGNAGDLTLNIENLSVSDGAKISVSTFGEGDAGSIDINSNDVSLFNKAEIIANSDGNGEGGSIFVGASNLELDNSFISATISSGRSELRGGNTNLKIEDTLSILNNSSISTSAFDNANAGNINIDSTFIIGSRSEVNELSSAAEQGKGGNIQITAEFLSGVDIKTSGVEYSSGNNSIFVDQINQVKDSVESERMVDQTCQSDLVGEKPSGLSIEGKGGVTPAPNLPLNSQNIIDAETNSAYNIPEPIETAQGKIQPARGIKFTKDGRIILTAYPTNNAGERIPEVKNNCGQI